MSGIGEVSPFEIGWVWPIIFTAPLVLIFARKARFWEALLWIVCVTMLTQAAMNFDVLEYWDLRSDRTFADPRATVADMQAATADGANKVFTFLFGWIPALFYALFWYGFWRWTGRRKRRKTG